MTKKILTVEVYSVTWGTWEIDNAYYEGSDMYRFMLTHSIVADHMDEVTGRGYMTAGLTDGSRRYLISDL